MTSFAEKISSRVRNLKHYDDDNNFLTPGQKNEDASHTRGHRHFLYVFMKARSEFMGVWEKSSEADAASRRLLDIMNRGA